MNIKIFTAAGWREIPELETTVNNWINEGEVDVVSITPSLCTIGGSEDQYQYMTITVVYNPAD